MTDQELEIELTTLINALSESIARKDWVSAKATWERLLTSYLPLADLQQRFPMVAAAFEHHLAMINLAETQSTRIH